MIMLKVESVDSRKYYRVDPRKYYREPLGCKDAVIQVVGSNALIYAPNGHGSNDILLQVREDSSYGAIGGASDLFVDETGNVVAFETEAATLRREFREETGHKLMEGRGLWNYIGCYTSILHYQNFPSVHAVGTYFGIETTPQRLAQYASGGGSEEGSLVVLSTEQVLQALKNNQVCSNAEPALRRLLLNWLVFPVHQL